MKVLFVSGSFNQGGAEYQILCLARLMKEKGHEIFVLAITDHDFYKPFLKNNGIQFSCLGNDTNKLKRVWQTSRFIRQYRPDAIVSFLKVPGLVTIFARMLSGVKCRLLLGERTAFVMPVRDFFHFIFWHLANAVTTNSVSKLEYFKRNFPLLRKKLHLVANIYDIQAFEGFVPERAFSPDKPVNIVYVGRVAPEKNLYILIESLARLKKRFSGFVFNIYGDTKHVSYKAQLEELIHRLDMDNHVIFHGPHSAAALKSVYNQADLLCLLSEYEGFSNVLAEAMIHGCVILSSNIPENASVVSHGVNGFLVDNKNIDSIAGGIEAFLDLSNAEKLEIRKRNREKALKIFDREAAYQQYLRLLN